MTLWMVYICPEGAMFKILLKSVEFEDLKNPHKVYDICRILAGVDDDFDVPDWE